MLCKYFPSAWQIILRNWGSVINYKEEEEEESLSGNSGSAPEFPNCNSIHEECFYISKQCRPCEMMCSVTLHLGLHWFQKSHGWKFSGIFMYSGFWGRLSIKVCLKMLNSADNYSCFDVFSANLKTISHLNLKLLCFVGIIWAMTCDFQQCGILTSVDSHKPVQPPFKRRNTKWCSVSSLTLIEYSGDKQRLWSDCAYVQADLRLWWSHIPHCWKSRARAHMQVWIFDFLKFRILEMLNFHL